MQMVGSWVPLSFATIAAGLRPIEVEAKFEMKDLGTLRQAVEANGGQALGTKSFVDKYWDTPDCTLARCDCWLRQRDDVWELKVPASDGRSGGERTAFREISGEDAILHELVAEHPSKFQGRDLAVALAGCVIFAEFTTTRAKFSLGGCLIDVDTASFGHSVMEIEVMVDDEDDIPAARAKIDAVAALVDAKPLADTGGKLDTYIRRHAPTVLAALVDAGILSPKGTDVAEAPTSR